MDQDAMQETMMQTEVTYTLEHEGKFMIVENVPARVCTETGEQFFSPETVEHLWNLINNWKESTWHTQYSPAKSAKSHPKI